MKCIRQILKLSLAQLRMLCTGISNNDDDQSRADSKGDTLSKRRRCEHHASTRKMERIAKR
ncbi:hypothetical protein VCR3J2_350234 [Vibrio coralliirubri]|nr:hypothetical protein VCR3J2_350234 [Vibrio coralliirubri]